MLNTTVAAPELQLLHVSMDINFVYLVHSPSYFVHVLGGGPAGEPTEDDSRFLCASLSEAATMDGRASLGLLFLTLSPAHRTSIYRFSNPSDHTHAQKHIVMV